MSLGLTGRLVPDVGCAGVSESPGIQRADPVCPDVQAILHLVLASVQQTLLKGVPMLLLDWDVLRCPKVDL